MAAALPNAKAVDDAAAVVDRIEEELAGLRHRLWTHCSGLPAGDRAQAIAQVHRITATLGGLKRTLRRSKPDDSGHA